MSTPPTLPPRALFTGLIDDAAVFPPGSATLEETVARRDQRRHTSSTDLVGPLLLPPTLVTEAVAGTSPLTVSVVVRLGAALAPVLTAARLLADAQGHSLAGIELGHSPEWRDALEPAVPVAVEVSADPAGLEALSDLAGEADGQHVLAKLRTGSTDQNAVPTPAQVAAFIVATVQHDVAFKLTGGLHHPIAHTAITSSGAEEQHGFLNVLLATARALDGATAADVSAVLSQRDSRTVIDDIRAFDDDTARTVRDHFHSYGCCEVLDPIRALADLRLIEETSL
ncbi:hypothetical protein [Luteipulveratus halotolerans]|uniref:hypothetical protein n=1 Tax=Luteipulveratus halotolerans TaxID=1631356 RepID=UPI00068305BE|nr:hypothetical protein [Luteipulveratus halotolerans]